MKNEIQPRGTTGQVVLGLMVIGLGLLFLLDNLGILDMRRAFAFWPMVFIVAGTVKLCDTRTQGGALLGGGLVGFGILLTLDRLEIIDFNWRTVWPLVLIGLGVYLVMKAMRGRRTMAGAVLKDGAGSDSVLDVVAVLGGFERRVATQDFRAAEITAIMGGCTLDMRGAAIQDEAVINVFSFWGGVTIKCPPDWTIVLEGTPILGAFEEKTVAPPHDGKRLVIRGYAIMGGVEVRN